MPLSMPDRRNPTASEVARDVQELLPQLERVVLLDKSVGTTQTAIAHGQRGAPRHLSITPHSDVRVWRSAPSDSRCIYLTASAACVVDVELIK